MTVAALYAFAQRRGHLVADMRFREAVSAAVQLPGGVCCIGIDRRRLASDAEEKVCLLHELGHCERGAFYARSSPVDNRARCEEMADRWAIQKELTYARMLRAMRSGCTEPYQLAEHFGVTEDLIRKAYMYYTEACGLSFD